MLAVSSALVARDLDRDQSLAASLWSEKFFDYLTRSYSTGVSEPARAMQTVVALCFLSLLDLVSPGSSRASAWEVIGSASRMFVALCEENVDFDDDCQRTGFFLFTVERPSLFCNSAPPRLGLFSPEYEFLSSTFQLHRTLYSISQHFALQPDPLAVDVENLIPLQFQIPPNARLSDMSFAQAQIYLSLHPLFTSPTAGPHSCSSDLLKCIAGAASSFISFTSRLNREHRVVSIWTTAESLLQAGAVWGAYLILSKQGEPKALQGPSFNLLKPGSSMEPLLQCSALLSSFAERWKPGRQYVQAWDAFTEMLWADMDLDTQEQSIYSAQNVILA
ncbi:hypothetical protein MPH_00206 [Macrophomina phaseolina MS6]|uniref:Transcription factor domain-containing protein n=1 Tax=Macrophomina phaseolina (strain MS6) TaxID=1126212 RepID=K2RIS8_MACPH|nr:hypothetical protein MPH_00206 [Macrophomina phaseolina MS6]